MAERLKGAHDLLMLLELMRGIRTRVRGGAVQRRAYLNEGMLERVRRRKTVPWLRGVASRGAATRGAHTISR